MNWFLDSIWEFDQTNAQTPNVAQVTTNLFMCYFSDRLQ